MRVTKDQIIKGVTQYIENDVIPQISDDRVFQIILDIIVQAIRTNPKFADAIFENNAVKIFLSCNEDGTYEIEGPFSMISGSVKKYGPFPVVIPPIRYISPAEKTLSFTESDIAELKRSIERSAE